MKKRLLTFISSILIISLLGCGNTSNTETLADTSASVNDISSSEEAVSDNESDVTDSKIYFEANKFELTTDKTFQIPFKPYITNTDYSAVITVPGISAEASPIATYTIDSVSVNDSWSDDYKDIVITTSISLPFKITFDGSSFAGDSWAFGLKYADFEFFDYETGAFIGSRSLFNDDSTLSSTDINTDNGTYTISVNKVQNIIQDETAYKDAGNEKYDLPENIHGTVVYTVTIPVNYDGLVLSLYKNGITDITNLDFSTEYSEKNFNKVLDQYENSSGSDYYVIKLSDL